MIHSIKRPLTESVYIIHTGNLRERIKAFTRIGQALRCIDKLPDPTTENTWHPNTKNLLILRDRIFNHWLIRLICLVPQIKRLLHRAIKGIIILYDFDPPWRWVFDSLKDEAFKLNWDKSWVSNLNYLRPWLVACCFGLRERRLLISVVMNLLRDIYKVCLPARGLFRDTMSRALMMDWEPKGFEDTWKYDWWKD